jgi:hypothetical protein
MSEKEQNPAAGGAPQLEVAPTPTTDPAHGPSSDEVKYSNGSSEKLDKPTDYATNEKSLNDEESGNIGQIQEDETDSTARKLRALYRKVRPVVHFLIWAFWTM